MKYLFHLGHPAHFHLFKNVIRKLKTNGHIVTILIKKKDILDDLLKNSGFEYTNILPKGRKDSKLGIALGMIETDLKLVRYCLKNKPDLMVGTSYAIAHVGKLLGIPSININEDDVDVVPLYCKLSYPFSTEIVVPDICDTGKWTGKSIKYAGYHELSYLHPKNFTPDKKVVEKYFPADEPYYIIRFAKLTAHHDKGITGITNELALKLIDIIKPFGKIHITSEREISPELEKFRISINPLDIHHVMAFARLYIGDSQTMAAEAGVLGTPFIRFNDFVGKIGYLRDIEIKYKLGIGIKPSETEKLLEKTEELVKLNNLREIYSLRRNRMLSEKIDVATFLTWFIENHPQSAKTMKENPDYQYNFK